jgi:hypothetical protein
MGFQTDHPVITVWSRPFSGRVIFWGRNVLTDDDERILFYDQGKFSFYINVEKVFLRKEKIWELVNYA